MGIEISDIKVGDGVKKLISSSTK